MLAIKTVGSCRPQRRNMSNSGDERKTEPAFSIDPYVIKDPEQFTLNLARAIEQLGKAASAWVTPIALSSDASVCTTRMPRPPPPPEALMITG